MAVKCDPMDWVRLGANVPDDCKGIGMSSIDGCQYYVTESGYEILRQNFFDYIESDLVFKTSSSVWLAVQFNCSNLDEVDSKILSSGKVDYLKRSPADDPPVKVQVVEKEVVKEIIKEVEVEVKVEVPRPLPNLADIVYVARELPQEYINPASAEFKGLWDILFNPDDDEERDEFVRRFFSTPSKDGVMQNALYNAFIERLIMLCNHDVDSFSKYIADVLEG